MKKGGKEAAEILYVNIKKNDQGLEEIEVTGKFLLNWIGRRVILQQITAIDTAQNVLYRHVRENVTAPSNATRAIPNFSIYQRAAIRDETIDYQSDEFANVLVSAEVLAKSAKLGMRTITDVRAKTHMFDVYSGNDLTSDQAINPPCVFSQEFDNIVEQEYTDSVENLKTTAYVGGQTNNGDAARQIAEVGAARSGLGRSEVFINATDLTKTYTENGVQLTISDAQYLLMLMQRGESSLEQYCESLSFSSKINTHANLKYGTDYDLGDRVTCINKRWCIKINVRITAITETYQQNQEEIEITFGESIPALLDKIRQFTK